MHWRPDQVAVLIDEYRKYPELYNPKNLYYTQRKIRSKATVNILEVLKKIRPDVTEKELLNKMASLRSSFCTECVKIAKSQEKSRNPDDVRIIKARTVY